MYLAFPRARKNPLGAPRDRSKTSWRNLHDPPGTLPGPSWDPPGALGHRAPLSPRKQKNGPPDGYGGPNETFTRVGILLIKQHGNNNYAAEKPRVYVQKPRVVARDAETWVCAQKLGLCAETRVSVHKPRVVAVRLPTYVTNIVTMLENFGRFHHFSR